MIKEFPHFLPDKTAIPSALGNTFGQLFEKEFELDNVEDVFDFAANQNRFGQVF